MSHTPMIDDFGVLRRLLMQTSSSTPPPSSTVGYKLGSTPPNKPAAAPLPFPPLYGKEDSAVESLMRDLIQPAECSPEEELWRLLSLVAAGNSLSPCSNGYTGFDEMVQCCSTPPTSSGSDHPYTPSKTDCWNNTLPSSPNRRKGHQLGLGQQQLSQTQQPQMSQSQLSQPQLSQPQLPQQPQLSQQTTQSSQQQAPQPQRCGSQQSPKRTTPSTPVVELDWATRPPAVLAHPDEFVNPSSFLKVYGDPLCGSTDKKGALLSRGKCGNWPCGNCGNVNYPRRFRCNKCGQRRSQDGDALVAAYALEVYQQHLKAFRSRNNKSPNSSTPAIEADPGVKNIVLSVAPLTTQAFIEPTTKRVPKLPLTNIDREAAPATARPFWRNNELSWSAVVRGHNTARCDADPSWREQPRR